MFSHVPPLENFNHAKDYNLNCQTMVTYLTEAHLGTARTVNTDWWI